MLRVLGKKTMPHTEIVCLPTRESDVREIFVHTQSTHRTMHACQQQCIVLRPANAECCAILTKRYEATDRKCALANKNKTQTNIFRGRRTEIFDSNLKQIWARASLHTH